jgi:hypothetical protein
MIPEDQLYTFINTLPFAAHVRDIKTNKYIIANKFQATNHGFQDVDSVINVTYSDIYHYRRQKISTLQGSLILEDQYKAFIDEANLQADASQTPLTFKACTLFPTGFIYMGLLKKIPLKDHKQRVVAILTYSEETTHHLDLLDLYNLYKKHYPVHQAISQFLHCLHITHYFQQLPTNQELITLLMLRRNSISKYVARQLGISYRTVEEYKARLRSKLKKINLDGLLVCLRMHPEKPIHLL